MKSFVSYENCADFRDPPSVETIVTTWIHLPQRKEDKEEPNKNLEVNWISKEIILGCGLNRAPLSDSYVEVLTSSISEVVTVFGDSTFNEN